MVSIYAKHVEDRTYLRTPMIVHAVNDAGYICSPTGIVEFDLDSLRLLDSPIS